MMSKVGVTINVNEQRCKLDEILIFRWPTLKIIIFKKCEKFYISAVILAIKKYGGVHSIYISLFNDFTI